MIREAEVENIRYIRDAPSERRSKLDARIVTEEPVPSWRWRRRSLPCPLIVFDRS